MTTSRLSRWGLIAVAGLAATALITVAPALPAQAAPNRNVPAGASIPAGTFAFADRVGTTCTRHVAVNGNDANTGATVATAWRTPAKAMAALTGGQTACVHAGTYDVATLTPAASGTATAPIGLIGAPGEARPVLRSTIDRLMFNFGEAHAYWVVQGFDLNKDRRNGPTVQVLGSAARPAHHIAIRNNLIRDSKAAAAVLLRAGTTDVLVKGNEIRNHHRWIKDSNPATASFVRLDSTYRRYDANAINLETTTDAQVARVLVQGNHLHDNGGDGLQCLGTTDLQPLATDAADLDLVDNRIHHNTEDGVDIKSCQRVSIRGSRSPALSGAAADNKLYGFRQTDQSADQPGNTSGGGAIVIHYFARNVLVENTRIWDSCRGVSIGRSDFAVSNIVLRRNLIFGLVRSGSACNGLGVTIDRAQGVDIYHNTFAAIPGSGLVLGRSNSGAATSDVDVFENVVELSGTGLWIDHRTDKITDFESDRNLFWAPDGSTAHLRTGTGGTGTVVDLATWRAGTGQDRASVHGNPLWVANPSANDYYTQAGSPARDRAVVTAGESYCGTAPDIGFRESGC